MKETIELEHVHSKNARYMTYDCSEYDGGGLYDDQGDQNFPDAIYSPGKLQTRLLLYFSDIISEIIDSDNEKFEDMFKFVKKETVLFLADIFKKFISYYRNGYLIDDFVRFVYDKKLINA